MTSQELEKIKSLSQQRRYPEALAACEALIRDASSPMIDTLRMRAYVLTLSGDYILALKDREAILNYDAAKLRDYYLAAECALSAEQPARAAELFETVVHKEAKEGDTWFRGAAHFLLAYAKMELGEYEEALHELNEAEAVDPGCAMPVPEGSLWTGERLRGEISRRRSGGKP